LKLLSATAFMGRSKIYASISKHDAYGTQERLLSSAKRKSALERLGVDVKSSVAKINSISGNATSVVKPTSSPVVFDSDWVNNIKHSLKNDNDLRGLRDIYEANNGELHVVFDSDVDLRKVINPMWRGIQAWNFTQLVFDRIDEENNALVYLQRAGDTNNHASPSQKTVLSATQEAETTETAETAGTTETTKTDGKELNKTETAKWIADEILTANKLKTPRGIWVDNTELTANGQTVRLEADIKQINSTVVDYDLVMNVKVDAPRDSDGKYSVNISCKVGTYEVTKHLDKSETASITSAVRDIIAECAKGQLAKDKDKDKS